jgi:hypothetical protein
MRCTLLLMLVLASIPGLAGEGSACSCVGGTPCDHARTASAVFLGTVTQVESNGYGTTMRLRVERAWKGAVGKSIEISGPPDGGACGLGLSVGERWVIFASGEPGRWWTSMCHGGWPEAEGRKLGFVMPPPGDVVGRLLRPAEHPRNVQPSTEPVAGARVSILSASGQIESRTDAGGRFRLRGMNLARPAALQVDLAPGETLPPTVVGFGWQEACGELPLLIGYTGRISGRVVDARGAGVDGAEVSAMDPGPGSDAIAPVAAAMARTDATGAYTLTGLRSGRYVVGVNVARPPTIGSPFAPVFHLASSTAAAASAVVVAGPARTDVAPIVVRRLPQTVLEVDVVCGDGTRPSDARIEVRPAAGGLSSRRRGDAGGHATVPVPSASRYIVSAAVAVRERRRGNVRDAGVFTVDAGIVTSGDRTTTVAVPVPLVGCDAPGGPIVPAARRP